MSYLVKQAAMPNGSVGTCHRPVRLEIDGAGASVIINSHADEVTDKLVWQDRYAVPLSAVASYPDGTLAWLAANAGPFQNATLLQDPTALDVLKAKIRTLIDAQRDSRIGGGVDTPAGRVDTDETSIRNLLGAYQSAVAALIGGADVSYSWRMADNSLVDLAAQGVIAMGNAVLKHTEDCYKRSWALKDQLAAAATVEDVLAIDLGADQL